MNKAELAKAVADHMGIPKKLAKDVLDVAIYQIAWRVKSGELVKLQEFGTLKPITRAARKRHNVNTGEHVQVEAKRTVKFVPSRILLEALN